MKYEMPDLNLLKGLLPVEIRNKYGIPYGTARQWFRKANDTGLKEFKTMMQMRAENKYKKIMELYPAFLVLTDAQLARAFEVSRERIGQIRQLYNIPESVCKNEQTGSFLKE